MRKKRRNLVIIAASAVAALAVGLGAERHTAPQDGRAVYAANVQPDLR
jgi:hypothetical protein